jgi:ABC-type antimicrobial peptide transport system permease subunit
MIQGGLGGLLAVGLLGGAARLLRRDLLAASDFLGRAPLAIPLELALVLVLGGMTVGIVGSLVSLRRVKV